MMSIPLAGLGDGRQRASAERRSRRGRRAAPWLVAATRRVHRRDDVLLDQRPARGGPPDAVQVRAALSIWTGRLLGTMMFTPYTAYREVHIRHHAYLNTPRDWELWPYSDPQRVARLPPAVRVVRPAVRHRRRADHLRPHLLPRELADQVAGDSAHDSQRVSGDRRRVGRHLDLHDAHAPVAATTCSS